MMPLQEEVYKTFQKLESQRAASTTPAASSSNSSSKAAGTSATTATSTSTTSNPNTGKSWEDLERQIFEDDDVDDDDMDYRSKAQDKDVSHVEEKVVVTVSNESPSAEEEEARYVPPPRQLGSKVAIGFTPRLFPTPMRESKRAEEEDWIARNRPYLKTNKVREEVRWRHWSSDDG